MLTKQHLLAACHTLLSERLQRLNNAIAESREAANNETKSSAGDKYETTREMMQAEMERLSQQVDEVAKLREGLFQAQAAMPGTEVALGSVVKTNRATYFLAAGLGKVTVGSLEVFIISTASPIGQLLVGKRVGQEIAFNGRSEQIQEVL